MNDPGLDFIEEHEMDDDDPEMDNPWGCLCPGECCMPGEHLTSECYTAEDMDAFWRKAQEDEFDAWWKAEGVRIKIDRDSALEVWLAARSEYPFQA